MAHIQTDTWTPASWPQFIEATQSETHRTGRAYYDQGYMRIEIAPLGAAYGQDNSVISTVVTLYGLAKGLPIKELINTSFRQAGVRECQPDLAYYIGSAVQPLPQDNAPVDMDRFGAPTLMVEIGATSFSDDLGRKRLLYEQLGVEEYWVINSQSKDVIAFAVAEGRSGRIDASQVLPNLGMALVSEALQRSAAENTSAIGQWLLQTYNGLA